jgi:hypothetical protein
MVTGQLSISYLQPVAVDTIVYVEVRLESRDGNRFNLEATVTTALVRKTPFWRATLCYFTKRGSGQTYLGRENSKTEAFFARRRMLRGVLLESWQKPPARFMSSNGSGGCSYTIPGSYTVHVNVAS